MTTKATSTYTSDVSLLGTGLMGAAIARRLARTGNTVTVWNRTPERAEPLAADGITVAATVGEAMRCSPLVISVVTGYAALRAALEDAVREGPIDGLVNLTSGTPAEADDLAAWLGAQGIAHLDGAIFAYPYMIGEAQSRIVYAGDAALFEQSRHVLEPLAETSTYLGAATTLANVLDVSLLGVVGAAYTACMEALALGVAYGLDAGELLSTFAASLLKFDGVLATLGTAIAAADHDTSVATVDTWRAAIDAVVTAGAAVNVRAGIASAVVSTLEEAAAAGWGSSGITAVYQHRLSQR